MLVPERRDRQRRALPAWRVSARPGSYAILNMRPLANLPYRLLSACGASHSIWMRWPAIQPPHPGKTSRAAGNRHSEGFTNDIENALFGFANRRLLLWLD